MTTNSRLQAGIIGAGIAGLSAAIALRRAGWDVEIFEKSTFKNEAGAAVAVGCNATRVLRRFGADLDAWGATENKQVRSPRGDTLEKVYVDSFADVSRKYGDRWLFFHRQDLHTGLRWMAEDVATAEAPPARIRLGCDIQDLDCEAGIIRLKNGDSIQKDLLVVANGIHCRFVEKISGAPSSIRNSGRTVHRFLVPMSEIKADPLTAQLFEGEPHGLLGPKVPGRNTICASYPCRNGTVLNLTYMSDTKPDDMDKTDWNSPATLSDVEQVTEGFHPAFRALPRKANNIGAYRMILRDEIPKFVRGRAVLIGDAAHPMLQYHAQGASQAIESAGALEIFFQLNYHGTTAMNESHRAVRTVNSSARGHHHLLTKNGHPLSTDPCMLSTRDIAPRLVQFNSFRHPRCTTAQIMSSLPPSPQTYPEVFRRVRKYYSGDIPPGTTPMWGEAFRDFFFSYDVVAEAEQFLRGECHDVTKYVKDTHAVTGIDDLCTMPDTGAPPGVDVIAVVS